MAEYIEREQALKIIDNYAKATTNEGKAVAEALKDIVGIICPAADVVPRAEVEMLEKERDYWQAQYTMATQKELTAAQIVAATEFERIRHLQMCELKAEIQRLEGKLIFAKQEVAREIFAEIETEIREALKSNYARRDEINMETQLLLSATVSGKITALRGLDDFIAELKKKYSEGGDG